jgi:hypothetical protein
MPGVVIVRSTAQPSAADVAQAVQQGFKVRVSPGLGPDFVVNLQGETSCVFVLATAAVLSTEANQQEFMRRWDPTRLSWDCVQLSFEV